MPIYFTPTFQACIWIFVSSSVVIDGSNNHHWKFDKEVTHPKHISKTEDTLFWAVKIKDGAETFPHFSGLEDSILKLKEQHENIFKTVNQKIRLVHSDHTQLSYEDEFKNLLAVAIAVDLNLELLGKIGNLGGHYLFHHPHGEKSKNISLLSFGNIHKIHKQLFHNRSSKLKEIVDLTEKSLNHHHFVEWFCRQKVRPRNVRSLHFVDPQFPNQWHLHNAYRLHMDINVADVWERNITGHGVTVAVVDDGLQWDNPDIQNNYSPEGSWDLNENDANPMPDTSKVNNHHGTRCAGEIAAVSNHVCGVGVAYNAKVAGIRVLGGPMTDSLEASAFNQNLHVNDVYSCSWGPDDDGKTVDGPHILAEKAMRYGIDFGRNGYGAVYVVASGNGGRHGDNCNYDGYANSIYTVTIGAVDEMGSMPYYGEECASMLAVTFSNGEYGSRNIVTTDWTLHGGKGCTDKHTGTSAAAPIAAGMIALMFQARVCLSWRDVQYLIILTAKKIDVSAAHWKQNSAGLWHSHQHGFGLMDAWRLVNAAKVWKSVPWLTTYTYVQYGIYVEISKGEHQPLIVDTIVSKKDIDGYDLFILEYVQVTLSIRHPRRGYLDIRVTCPSGTESVIGATRPHDNSSLGFDNWTFSTVRCWGESPSGLWKVTITDTDNKYRVGKGVLLKWQLRLHGTPITPEQFQERRKTIEDAMDGKKLNDQFSLPCSAPPVTSSPDTPVSQKTLKILVLAGAFCVVMAVYESFEYIFCYNSEKKEHRRLVKLARRANSLMTKPRVRFSDQSNTEVTEMQPLGLNRHGSDASGSGGANGNRSAEELDITEMMAENSTSSAPYKLSLSNNRRPFRLKDWVSMFRSSIRSFGADFGQFDHDKNVSAIKDVESDEEHDKESSSLLEHR